MVYFVKNLKSLSYYISCPKCGGAVNCGHLQNTTAFCGKCKVRIVVQNGQAVGIR